MGSKLKRLLCCALLSATSAGAWAQAETAPPAAEDSAAGDIIVTAQRREERLQDVPISMAVVSGQALQQRAIQNFEQLAPIIPNLTIAKSPAANLIVLRGIGSSPGSPSLDQSVVMFVDGIYGGNARQFSMPFMDIERFEILRGPQGALVGRNTSAGAINIITRKPGTEFGGYVNATYNFDQKGPSIEGGVDIPVSDAVRFRVVGKYTDMDGYIRNTELDEYQPDRREKAVRVVGVVDNGGPVTVTAKYEHSDIRANGIPMQVLAPSKGYPLDFTKDTFLVPGPENDDVRADNAALQFDVELGALTLVSITGYSGFTNDSLIDADFFVGQYATAIFNQKFDQFSQELRLLSPAEGPIRYVVGAYYSAADLFEQRTTGVLFAPPASTYREFRQTNYVYSLFGQLSWQATDKLRFNGSGRYTRETKKANYLRLIGPLAATDFVGAVAARITGDLADGRFDPAFSVQYDFDSNRMVYASYGQGSKSGGFQGAIGNATQDGFEFLPERSTSYEAGAKFSFPGTGFFNIAGFYTIYHDLQVSATIPTNGSLVAAIFTGNAPKARTAGIEADFSLELSPIFRIDGNVAWLPEAKYVTFTSGPCYPLQVPDGSVPGSCDLSGERLGFTPKYSGALNFTAEVPLASTLKLTAALSPRYQSFSYRDFSPDPVTAQDAFAKLDARIALGSIDNRWELSLIGQNLTNAWSKGFGGAGGLANTFLDPGAHIVAMDPQRSFSLQGRLNF